MHAVAEGRTVNRRKTGKSAVYPWSAGATDGIARGRAVGRDFHLCRERAELRGGQPGAWHRRASRIGKRERRLSEDEYAALGTALRRSRGRRGIWPAAIAAVRFLALTGWRSGRGAGATLGGY